MALDDDKFFINVPISSNTNLITSSTSNLLTTDFSNSMNSLDIGDLEKQLELQTENEKLKKDLIELKNKLGQKKENIQELEKKYLQLKEELEINENKQFLKKQINDKALNHSFSNKEFYNSLVIDKMLNATIISIDIRKSTELMLKVKKPELFSKFITELTGRIYNIIINKNYGIFDKFTGDGILAFFPDFYSGEDSVLCAINTAIQAHNCFEDFYNENLDIFHSVLANTGLGIGIDYGEVYYTKIYNNVTVIGPPVVYACRFSGYEAGSTYLNQSAKTQLLNLGSNLESFIIQKTKKVKNESPTVVYKIMNNIEIPNIKKPEWNK